MHAWQSRVDVINTGAKLIFPFTSYNHGHKRLYRTCSPQATLIFLKPYKAGKPALKICRLSVPTAR